MPSRDENSRSLPKRIQALSNAQRSQMCWELGYFETPMFVKEPGKPPSKPYMLVCIDTASRAIIGSNLLLDPPAPKDFLSLLISSMETPCVGSGDPVRPESVRLDDPVVFKLVGSKLRQLNVKIELVEQLSALPEFKKDAERELFSRQPGYSGSES